MSPNSVHRRRRNIRLIASVFSWGKSISVTPFVSALERKVSYKSEREIIRSESGHKRLVLFTLKGGNQLTQLT